MKLRSCAAAVVASVVLGLVGCGGEPLEPYSETVVFDDLLIDGVYPSMFGPSKSKGRLRLAVDYDHTENIWVTRYQAEVLNADGSQGPQEFMCHSHLFTTGVEGAPSEWRGDRGQLSISQGQREIRFPEGYALMIPYNPYRDFAVMGMVLNNNYPDLQKTVRFEITFDYHDDRQAQELELKPLALVTAATYLPIDDPQAATLRGSGRSCEPVSIARMFNMPDGSRQTGHWYVPPGRHVYTTDTTPFMALDKDTHAHYIWMHVHPYAESIELWDATANGSVWKGKVSNDPELAVVEQVDSFSSLAGIALYRDHRYALITVYNNPTDQKIDAMASLWIYVDA